MGSRILLNVNIGEQSLDEPTGLFTKYAINIIFS
jgi:hypothetical protein